MEATMHCPNCGTKIYTVQKFCRACGLPLEPFAQLLAELAPDAEDENVAQSKLRLYQIKAANKRLGHTLWQHLHRARACRTCVDLYRKYRLVDSPDRARSEALDLEPHNTRTQKRTEEHSSCPPAGRGDHRGSRDLELRPARCEPCR